MEFFNSLNLTQIKGGTKLKQGDLGSVLSYSLTDENGQEITSFDNKTAYINLVLDDKIWFTTTTLVDISRVTFRIDKAIPIGLYYLEIKIDDYIFPSDRDSIILIEEGSTPYDLKELVPNYDVNMTLKGILSDLSQKGIDISDLNRRIGNVNAELIASRNGKSNLKARIDDLENKTTAQLAEKANKDEVTNVMTPRGNIAYASLPKTGNSVGWYYYCPDGDGTHGAGNYVWNGTSWYFGGTGDEGYNLLKKDIGDVRTEKETNLLKFIDANWTTSNVLVSSDADSSIMHIKANNLTLASQQVFNVMLNNLIILEPNTTYTLSTSIIRAEATQIRANNIALCRRDNYANVALIAQALNDKQSNKYTTFTTPSDETRFYIAVTFAKGAWDCDIDLNINISKGSEPNYKQYGIVVDLNNALPTIDRITKHNVHDIVVAKDGSGDFASLTEAVANAKDFDVIYVKNGLYENEIVKAWRKTVFIIGESRDGVIITNSTGEYATPPVEMGTGLLRNLTIYAKDPGGVTPKNKCYALHSESSVYNYFKFEIDNCNIISDWRQSWGMGMRGSMVYHAHNVNFDGGVYFHDNEHTDGTVQKIFFDTCNITRDDTGAALIMQDQQMSSADIDVRFNRCFIKSLQGSEILFYKWVSANKTVIPATGFADFPSWGLNAFSWGNSEATLNA